MSEGKSAVVTLSPEALRRIALDREKQALERILSVLRDLADEAAAVNEDYGSDIVVDVSIPKHAEEPEQVRAAVEELQTRVAATRTTIDQVVSGHLAETEAEHSTSLAGDSIHASDVLAEPSESNQQGESSISERRKASAAQNAAHALEQLSRSAPVSAREDLEMKAASIVEKDSATEAQALATEIMLTVQETNERLEEQLRRVEQLRLDLLGLDSKEAAEGYEWLGLVQAGEVPMDESRLQLLEELLESETGTAHDEYIANATQSVLEELGYDVEVGFANSLAGDGKAMARRSNWPNHAVVIDKEDGRLVWKVKRTESVEAGVSFDESAQTEFCEDYRRIAAAMADRGLDFDPSKRTPPGVVASEVVERPPRSFASRRREAEKLRERDLGGTG